MKKSVFDSHRPPKLRRLILDLFSLKPELSVFEIEAGLYNHFLRPTNLGTIHTALHRMEKDKKLERVSKGHYRLPQPEVALSTVL